MKNVWIQKYYQASSKNEIWSIYSEFIRQKGAAAIFLSDAAPLTLHKGAVAVHAVHYHPL